MIGKIQRVPLREVWKHEALDLTKWLQDNLDVLNDVLEFSLFNAEREQSAGDFSVDLVAEDEDGSLVVIENQLEKSDHAHLGKLITYLTLIGAKKALWIVGEPRPEHVAAITWLNESSSAAFYLLKIEGIRINDSAPAPLLTLIVGPSEEGREVGEAKKELAERYDLRHRFWAGLLERAKNRTKLHAHISPGQYSWIGAGSGRRGLGFNYAVRKHEAKVELYIDRGKDSGEENKSIFDSLHSQKEAIEKEFGGPLDWQRLEGKRACRIMKLISVGGYRDEVKWNQTQDAMIDAMIRLEKALKPHIAKLQL
ncbi:MAG TPA: DUF4268 domain-containing protein [Candidatus Acidoferrum sp.]|nr:DUF4268 domain-containing protein [Candidatus Acidoferrum sp.]